MSGETEVSISAWTVDSLHTHLLGLMEEKEKAFALAMTAYNTAVTLAAERTDSEVAAIRDRYDVILAERDTRYDERFDASQVAISAALVEREKAIQAALVEREKAVQAAFAAQETAIQLALTGIRTFYDTVLAERDARYDQRAEHMTRDFMTRIEQVRSETVVAMAAADKAISKSEAATERRFECVSADTPILCADLIWRPAGDLLVGDELIACDEVAPTRSGRRFRRSIVTHNSLERDALLLVTTPKGSIRCNANHPWLVRRGAGGTWQWIKTQDLRSGDCVMYAVDTWGVDRSWDAGWLAGMFDGEGCLSLSNNNLQLTLSQRESLTSDNIASALKERIGREALTYRMEPGTPSTPNNTKPFFHFMVTHRPDVMKLLGTVRPPRLLTRSDAVWEGRVLAANNRTAVVTSIESLGTGLIAQLSTSTATYIAGGFVMHNSVNEFRAQQADIITTFARKSEVDARLIGLTEKVDACNAQAVQIGATTLPRNEYDRAHTDLAERVVGVEKSLNEKIEAQVKTIEARISLLQSQISSIEAVTR